MQIPKKRWRSYNSCRSLKLGWCMLESRWESSSSSSDVHRAAAHAASITRAMKNGKDKRKCLSTV